MEKVRVEAMQTHAARLKSLRALGFGLHLEVRLSWFCREGGMGQERSREGCLDGSITAKCIVYSVLIREQPIHSTSGTYLSWNVVTFRDISDATQARNVSLFAGRKDASPTPLPPVYGVFPRQPFRVTRRDAPYLEVTEARASVPFIHFCYSENSVAVF